MGEALWAALLRPLQDMPGIWKMGLGWGQRSGRDGNPDREKQVELSWGGNLGQGIQSGLRQAFLSTSMLGTHGWFFSWGMPAISSVLG